MATAAPRGPKRLRESVTTAEDVKRKAAVIIHEDPFKERAPRGEERAFRALFGCSWVVAFKLWKLLLSHRLLPNGGSLTHLLWTLMFLKVYPTEDVMKKLTGGTDQKTIRKWVFLFVENISMLEPFLVSRLFLPTFLSLLLANHLLLTD